MKAFVHVKENRNVTSTVSVLLVGEGERDILLSSVLESPDDPLKIAEKLEMLGQQIRLRVHNSTERSGA